MRGRAQLLLKRRRFEDNLSLGGYMRILLGFSNSPGASARASVFIMTTSTTPGQAQLPLLRDTAPRGNSHLVNILGMNLSPRKDGLGLSLGASMVTWRQNTRNVRAQTARTKYLLYCHLLYVHRYTSPQPRRDNPFRPPIYLMTAYYMEDTAQTFRRFRMYLKTS